MAVIYHYDTLLQLYFAEGILTRVHLQHLQLKHIGNYLHRTLRKQTQNNNSRH